MAAKRPTVSRLLVSPDTATAVENVRIDLLIKTRREWTKTAINDALLAVALRHLDEVAEQLAQGGDSNE
jgi:hypothetical protein